MALSALKNSFAGKAAAVGIGAMVAFAPLSSTFAQDAGASRNPAITRTATSTLTQEQVSRLEVEAAAFDYAKDHPGHIGVSILKGPDAGQRRASDLASGFERGIEGRYGIQAAGYAGDNGNKPTEITFHYLMVDTDKRPLVRSVGPYNMDDALKRIPEVASAVRATAQYASLAYSPYND